jgi:Domain of unknown function (DUF4279)
MRKIAYTRDPDCAGTFVSFGMRSEKLVPDEITKALGMSPSHVLTKGDPISPRSPGAKRPWGVWSLSTEGKLRSSIIEKHVEYLLRLLRPKREVILPYVSDPHYYVDIRCILHTKYLEGGFTLPAPIFQELCEFCQDVNFDFVG